ncbi:MAG: hypothetical protein ACR2OU_00235 [Thermomicrobiales bacterium]
MMSEKLRMLYLLLKDSEAGPSLLEIMPPGPKGLDTVERGSRTDREPEVRTPRTVVYIIPDDEFPGTLPPHRDDF